MRVSVRIVPVTLSLLAYLTQFHRVVVVLSRCQSGTQKHMLWDGPFDSHRPPLYAMNGSCAVHQM